TADGAVPIHFKAYSGNRTDDTTHIQTWKQLRELAGVANFLYVADCKVCTDSQLSFITEHGGRVVSLMPDTWAEAKAFKQSLRESKKTKRKILQQPVPNRAGKLETFYLFTGSNKTSKRGYTLHWIYSTEKRKRDRHARDQHLVAFEQALSDLIGKLNQRRLKTEHQIRERVDQLLEKHRVHGLYHIDIVPVRESSKIQIGKGRPGKDTRYKTQTCTLFSLAWSRNKQALKQERRCDGVFPILCTDETLSAKAALLAYKYQPRLEKRFEQLKTVHNGAPTLFKKVERVEAMMFLFFMALVLQAVLEREVRYAMIEQTIDSIPVYPEHRLSAHPTTARIVDRFQDISLYRLFYKGNLAKQYEDELTPLQRKVLKLVGMSEDNYWQQVI
ncbi:IS1634 family transposase, partial [Granulosicoccus sp.]|nr:IS1634 family transposase [Granulosicoccus sp.]